MPGTVHIVHCIDTEGPLHESVEATFERLKAVFGLELEPSTELLRLLQAGAVDLGGIEAAVRKVIDPHLLAYNDTWDKVDAMLEECMSAAFRGRLLDADGNGWVYNWFCTDHVGYEANPRRRDIGYHNVFDHYRRLLGADDQSHDGLQFHYHPHNYRHEAHRCAAHWWASSDSLQQIFCRRVIDRQWFPAANRPGFHVIRPDSHWFLEQFIPFDFSNQALTQTSEDAAQAGLEDGRWGDWRRAPVTWEPYHPSHDDYQVKGACRRWIARCLNVGTRYRLMGESDVRQAFREAEEGVPVVLAFTDHDFRDIRPDVGEVRRMLERAGEDFPGVPFRFCEAVEAMRSAMALAPQPACSLGASLRPSGGSAHTLEIWSDVPTFGPQPWLALKTVAGSYHHDNFDIDQPFHRWRYVFDEETFPISALSSIGVATNNSFGVTTVLSIEPETGDARRWYWNMHIPAPALPG